VRILLVDDERELTDPLTQVLRREGYDVDVTNCGITGERLAAQRAYDLLILDWLMPERSGLQICQRRRACGDATPVLFLTAKDTLDDRVSGLDAGADDYLVKPFELRELLARVRALLRRTTAGEASAAERLQVADLSLDRDNQLAYRNGRAIELSAQETQLLSLLMRHPGQVLSHAQIRERLWSGQAQPSSNVLAARIRLLRRKIEGPQEEPLIHTVYGRGYRLGSPAPPA